MMVVAEAQGGRLTSATLEVLGFARQAGQPVWAVLVAAGGLGLAEELASAVERVYLVDQPSQEPLEGQLHLKALAQVVQAARPALLLFSPTDRARDLAPRLAARLNVGVVTGCVELRLHQAGQGLEAVCAAYGGAARTVYRFGEARPAIVVVQAGTAEPASLPGRQKGEVVQIRVALDATARRARVVRAVATPGPRLEDAQVIVAGGRGLGRKENFRHIEELAEVLGGLPAASRAIVDLGWATPAQQVGLTGKVVTPRLYLAIGISGASQHMAGCSAAKSIVAVNKDKDAAIFRYARYGVEADCLEFLPLFIQESRKLRQPRTPAP
ncbi:MAG: electron transfer flavoprotein subunit alpha/FixB family protein [Chloroflexi bacterium]|nr:electron transfer flavoprotein subunit alpha/FixB family protein [Chloroflexota bacterium]